MLTMFRRHLGSCPHVEKGRVWRKCKCPISVEGRLVSGKIVRRALNTSNWQFAADLVLQMEVNQQDTAPITVGNAITRFLADGEGRHLSPATTKKYRVLLSETRLREGETCSPTLLEFAADKGIQLLQDFTPDSLREFRAQWHDGALAAGKKLERLRSFFRFCVDSEWIPKNPAKVLKAPVNRDCPTLPYSNAELKQLYDALPAYRTTKKSTARGIGKNSDHIDRLHALLRVMEFSGLRVGDSVALSTDDMLGDRLFLDTSKTGVKVFIPLPGKVVKQIRALPLVAGKYFFWSGEGKIDTATGNYRRSLRGLAKAAGMDDVHPHRMRDTMAIRLLGNGVPIERVAMMLGHTDIRVTQRHYSAWVQTRQDQAEVDVRGVWKKLAED